ncbi:ribonuclease H-like protein [Mycena sanguinolenta]|nr:ribonuclease H-like protein [Mycena sanguinolenta]
MKAKFYAVKVGKETGVFETWCILFQGLDECKARVTGFSGAKYKSFSSRVEAVAWIEGTDASSPVKPTTASDDKGKKRLMSSDVDDETGWDVVYTDGACKGNGQAGSVAGVGVWWGEGDPRNIAERCPGDQTNNRAELIAILRVLEETPRTKKPLLIKSDSQYSINCFSEWLPKWKRNGFKTASGDVKNAPLIKYLSAHLDARALRGQKVRLQYVKGHAGITGNEGADTQANIGATKPSEPERDWAKLEAHQRQLDQEFSRTNKPEPTHFEVRDAPDSVAADSGESPTKTRKMSHKPPSTATALEPLKPSSRSAPQVPVRPVPVVQPSSIVPRFTADDLAQYADGLLDDDDLMADLSD